MILIVASPTDAHARCVAHDLHALGKQVEFADTLQLGRGAHLTFGLGDERRLRWISASGQPIVLDETRVVWQRRYYFPHLPNDVRDPDVRRFAAMEWGDLVSGLLASVPARFVNDPNRQRAAVKPYQLYLARQHGLRVPETLISSDRAEVTTFVERHHGRLVHKALRAMESRVVYTKRWSASDADHLSDLDLAPALFQELIDSRREVRATIVGDRIFAAEFTVPEGLIDARLDVNDDLRPHALPADVQARLLELMRGLGLVLGTVDLKVTAEGEYVFLEINPQGQFLYVERLAGLPISAAVAELLASYDD